MATKKVLVEIEVKQSGSPLKGVTDNVSKLTAVEKERLRVKNETEKIDAKIEIANEKAVKSLNRKKEALKGINSQSKTWTGIMKESIAQIGKTNDGLKALNKDYKAWEKSSAAAAKEQERLQKQLETDQIRAFKQEVGRLAKEETELQKITKKLNYEKTEEAKVLAKARIELQLARRKNEELAIEQMKLADSTGELTDKMQQFKTTAGLSGAIVTEFGRTISDLPYGIRGVGNNVSQLVTLFGLFSQNVVKAGGTMRDGFKLLFSQMTGVIGLMTGLQVVIAGFQSGVIQNFVAGLFSAGENFKTLNELAEKSSQIMGGSIGTFKSYISILNRSNLSEKERLATIEKLNDEYPDFDASIYNNVDAQEAQNRATERYIELLTERARSEAAQAMINESYTKIFQARQKESIELAPKLEEVKELEDRIAAFPDSPWVSTEERRLKEQVKVRKARIEAIKESNAEEIKQEEKRIEFLQNLIKAPDSDKKTLRGRAPSTKTFKKRLLDLSRLEEKFRQESLKGQKRTAEEEIMLQEEFSRKELEIRKQSFIEAESQRLKNFLGVKELTEKQTKEIVDQAEEEANGVIIQIEAVTKARKEQLAIQQELDRLERGVELGQAQGRSINEVMALGMERVNAEIALNDARYNAQLADYERRIALEQKDTEERKRLLHEFEMFKAENANRDLENEKLVLDEKQRVNQEYMNYVQSLSGILSGIAGENEAIRKASIVLEKGVAITGVAISASRSISEQVSAKASYAAQAKAYYAAVPGAAEVLIANNNARVAKNIAKTKAGAGLSIAAIAAGAVSGLTTKGDGSTSGDTTVKPPDFNIIGSSGVNQLAEAIGSTDDRPIKAYVVSSEVTTQQALDRNTRDSATL